MPVAAYVLQDFSRDEVESVAAALAEAHQGARAAVVLGLEKAVSGVRVDSTGNPVAPKQGHQNGKGVRQKKPPKKAAGTAAVAAVAEQPLQG